MCNVKTKLSYLPVIFLLLAANAWSQETRMVPISVDGKTVSLEMLIYKPEGEGPFPTIIFNHGSTGTGRDENIIKRTLRYTELGNFFVKRGWAVVAPARRGRAGSEGIYDEGFNLDRSQGYTCETSRSVEGADRALRDVEAAINEILSMPFVDGSRLLIGGNSRGGILSVAYAGQHIEQVKGVVNFVGGWIGTRCVNADQINQGLFRRGSSFPQDTIWLYGNRDPYYPLSHSRKNYQAFQSSGGKGNFHEFEPPQGFNGHAINSLPQLWTSLVEEYLKDLGLPYVENLAAKTIIE